MTRPEPTLPAGVAPAVRLPLPGDAPGGSARGRPRPDRGSAPHGRAAGRHPPDLRRPGVATSAAEIRDPRPGGVRALLLGGETGGGEAYMDGLWSSPDLAGAPARRGAQPRTRWPWRPAGGGSRRSSGGRSPTGAGATRGPNAAAEHRRPLRPGQRLLPAVPRRDDDLLERRLRGRRPVARGGAAGQVPAHGRAGRPARRACTSWRSAPAGAASRSTPPASSDAG